MINSSLLRGKIYTKYKSMAEFARDIGWSRQRLHNVMTGKKTPDVNDIKILQEALRLSESEVFLIFLPTRSRIA